MTQKADRRRRLLFVVTILTGSFLLFLVQPMIARIALPRLGGAPAVWNSAMLVYQALLLGGYAYAHALGRFGPRGQGAIHVAVLAAAMLWLPLGLSAMAEPAGVSPALFVPMLLAVSIGPLFFAVAAQAPLMQRWFALRGADANPYWLYAASNLGSFGGLFAYPLLVEPLLTLAQQRWLWTGGYCLLFLLVSACAVSLRGGARDRGAAHHAPASDEPAPGLSAWLGWIALAAVPSGLMLSTTTHLTTDIVAMPLIWVIPLGLYLLSFSVAFAPRGRLAGWIAAPFAIVLVIAGEIAFLGGKVNAAVPAASDIALLFVVAVALHRRMYETRPAPAHLTAFYLAMSIGGVIGGLFCALIAPVAFDWVYEHPLLILAAAALMPQPHLFRLSQRIAGRPGDARVFTICVCIGALLLSLVSGGVLFGPLPMAVSLPMVAVLALLALLVSGWRIAFAVAVGAMMLGGGGWDTIRLSWQEARTRSYFGVYTVGDRDMPGGRVRMIVHGTTLHGVQRLSPGHERDATSYYAPQSGVGEAVLAAPALFGRAARIGVVGLGAGTLACYKMPGQAWTFYEIDPAVVRIARESGGFTFLSRCAPDARIVLGDARISLARESAATMDLLIVDAFSSDAVPMHLLTHEALAVYQHVLAPGGVLMIHISNRFFDLEPVLAAGARESGWRAALRDYAPTTGESDAGASRSIWVALARDPATLAALTRTNPGGWRALVPRAGLPAWTDDYSTVLPVLRMP